ncbi:MAG: plasmid recombination protein [Duncaniella sp.]
MMDFKPVKSVDANVSNEHQRNWSDELFECKAKNPDHNYDRSRTKLNFQVGPGGVITAVDKSRRVGDRVEEIIKKHLRPDARVTAISNRAVMVVFGGNRERMREMAFGSQVLNDYEETNGHLVRQPEIEQWAKDIYGFVCREFGEENVASFIVHLDETGPHAHCVFVPLTADGRLCSKEVLGGKNKIEARQHMRDLHTRLAEVNRKYGLDRGDDIQVTGARHRSTAEYNRDLHRENTRLETLISDKSGQLGQLEEQIKKAETRVKGLTTMIANLERLEVELNDEIAQLESDIENGAGSVSELRCRIASLESQLESTGQKLANKRDKLKLADRQLAELQDELHTVKEKQDSAQKNYHEFTEKNQEQVRMRLTDAVFARMVVDARSLLEAMPSEQKAGIDGEFLTAIAEQPNEILKCAMYLFLGYLDGATQFAQSCGGGGTSSDLPWGRNPNEDDRRFAYRCMMQAHKMLKPSQPKRGVGGRR